MDIKEWLSRGRIIYKRVKALEKSRAMAYDSATRTTPDYGHHGGKRNGISRKAEDFSALSEELDQEWRRLDKTLAEITALIGKIEDNTLATLLQDRYVRCMTWEQIATEMGYSREHLIRSLHPAALAAAKEVTEYHYEGVL